MILNVNVIKDKDNIALRTDAYGHIIIGRNGAIKDGSVYKSYFSTHSERKDIKRYSAFLIYMGLPHEDIGY